MATGHPVAIFVSRYYICGMEKGTRLYINITNRCNTDCPFCCMYSGTSKTLDMKFETFKRIIDDCEGEFEVQFEGGEPLIHKHFYLFLAYAMETGRCKKVNILTNGILLGEHLHRLVHECKWGGIPFEVKVSVNYWLLKKHEGHLKYLADYVFATEFIPDFNIVLNTRKRHGDEWIDEEIKANGMEKINHSFYLQSYGKMTGSDYDGVQIVQNIEEWKIYSVDGLCFQQDLVARSEHERNLT